MKWVIEDGIPIPPQKRHRPFGGPGRVASPEGAIIKELGVNQSVLIDGVDFDRIRRICNSRTRHKGMKYVTREEGGSLRIWRVE